MDTSAEYGDVVAAPPVWNTGRPLGSRTLIASIESFGAPPVAETGRSARRATTSRIIALPTASAHVRIPYAAMGALCSAYFTAYAIAIGGSLGSVPSITA